jgi:hypothetical protein
LFMEKKGFCINAWNYPSIKATEMGMSSISCRPFLY